MKLEILGAKFTGGNGKELGTILDGLPRFERSELGPPTGHIRAVFGEINTDLCETEVSLSVASLKWHNQCAPGQERRRRGGGRDPRG